MKYVLRTRVGVDVELAAAKVRQFAKAETGNRASGDYAFDYVSADLDADQLQKVSALGLFDSVELEQTTKAWSAEGS